MNDLELVEIAYQLERIEKSNKAIDDLNDNSKNHANILSMLKKWEEEDKKEVNNV